MIRHFLLAFSLVALPAASFAQDTPGETTYKRAKKPKPQPEPQQQQPQQQQPQQGGAAPADVTERVLQRKFDPTRVQQILQEAQGAAAAPDRWYDGSGQRIESNGRPAGTPFFTGRPDWSQSGGTPVPVPPTSGGYRPSTAQDANQTLQRYKSIPGGVVLEGTASLGAVQRVRYDRRVNAFVLDERAVYFLRVPPRSVALLCEAIARDDKVGVSLGQVQIVYGAVPADSELALDLKIADHFLGDIVFARNEWSAGYRFASDYRPQPHQGSERYNVAVFFNFNGFEFRTEQEEIRPTRQSFDVRLLPLSAAKSAEGGHLPDLEAIARGQVSRQFEANARHVADHISYYRREPIVDRTFAYGEAAAFIRGLRRSGIDLQALARTIR